MSYANIFSPAFAAPKFVDHARSRTIAKLLNAQPKRACQNAVRALVEQIGTGMYVEGLVVDFGLLPYIREHAWVLTEHTIVDPTPGLVEPTKDVAYFDVHMWTLEDLKQILERDASITLPLARKLPSAGKESAVYRGALAEAHRHLAAVHLRDSGMPYFAKEHEEYFVRALVRDWWELSGSEVESATRPEGAD